MEAPCIFEIAPKAPEPAVLALARAHDDGGGYERHPCDPCFLSADRGAPVLL